jgi:hypothetical protein
MYQAVELCLSQPQQDSYAFPSKMLQLWIKSLTPFTPHQSQQSSLRNKYMVDSIDGVHILEQNAIDMINN